MLRTSRAPACREKSADLESGDLEAAQAALSKVFSAYDKALKSGIIHKNRASRKKARLQAKLAAASG